MTYFKTKFNRHTWQLLFLGAMATFLLVMIYQLRTIFNPVLLALVLAYIFNPVVELLQKLKLTRTVAVFITYLLISGVIVATILILLPLVWYQFSILYENAFVGDANNPSYVAKIVRLAEIGIQKWNEHYPKHKLEVQHLIARFADQNGIEQVAQTLVNISLTTLETAFETLINIFWILSYLVLLPLYTFFLLESLPGIWITLDKYLPVARKNLIHRIIHRIHLAISAFFRGKLIICLLKGLLTWGLLELMGIKFSLIFGCIQAIASIVPFLVLAVGLLPNLLLVYLEMGFLWQYLVGILILYALLEGVEGFLFTPWIMGKETGLHPLTVILSLMVGGKLLGLFGFILAIPLTTTLKILAEEIILPQLREVAEYQPPKH